MKPGRELDALVAEKVMGWENNKDSPTFIGAREDQIYADTGDWKVIDCPEYSTDISAAWEVVERMKNNAFFVLRVGDEYKCRFDWLEFCYADTAPHAICLAALKAKGVEV